MSPTANHPGWMTFVLKAAGVYNLAWGAFVILFPNLPFRWIGLAEPNYPELWQCIGMIVGVYGIGYWCAASDPTRHWPIVLVGFLGKIFGPIGFLQAAAIGRLPWVAGWTIVTNDLIWWIPFGLILWHAFRNYAAPPFVGTVESLATELATARTGSGQSIADLSDSQPLFLVAVRHNGCTFCRETIAQLATHLPELKQRHWLPVVLHMGTAQDEATWTRDFSLDGVQFVQDPDRRLYRALELPRGTAWQLFGLPVWSAAVFGGAVLRHGVGELRGDGFQMPGTFIIQNRAIRWSQQHHHAGDPVNWTEGLACQIVQPA